MTDLFERKVHCILGLPFDELDLRGAASVIRNAAIDRRPCFFSTPNLNFLIACLGNDAFRKSVIDSDLSLADGMPIVWVARLLGIPIRSRVSGSDVFEVLRRETGRPISVYFFGGMEGAADIACKRLGIDSPGMTCVGHENPGFGSVEEMSSDATISRINASGADFLVVSLGAMKGQAWIVRNRNRLSPTVISHLGAVLNFVAGTVSRAPTWMQRWGLEWLWRIKEEPALWRRYFTDGLAFLSLLITRIAPYMWYRLIHCRSKAHSQPLELEVIERETECEIRLHGACAGENLDPLRKCLSSLALSRKDVCIVMQGVTYADSTLVGLLLLLDGNRRGHGNYFSIGNASEPVKKILQYSCAEFLLCA